MDNIRLILLLIGAVIVLGIYLYGRYEGEWSRRPKRDKRQPSRLPPDELPVLDDLDDDIDLLPEFDRAGQRHADADLEWHDEVPADEPPVMIRATRPGRQAEPKREPVPPAPERRSAAAERKPAMPERKPAAPGRIFSLFILAPSGVPFRGPILLAALEDAMLEYGDMQIFHRSVVIDGKRQHQFSVANIREPGYFDLSAMENFTTEGIVLFLQVTPGVDAVRAFDAMVESAKMIADELGGTVCDATRSFLTKQTIGHLREEVIGCQLQQRVMKTGS